ncbi:superoxide dismutase family protein [Bacillus sp. T33-2]|uniref:superoxide dismutase family protein n=1 Tax=Bacillus sp. T33-2 TaxID=2054168 RepID=UPI000C766095|nr:superoxide dismutase family protein [Bacillus sp. T33-2]PLR99281.1 superoxide dismutase [Bacillus sp. T33-2]
MKKITSLLMLITPVVITGIATAANEKDSHQKIQPSVITTRIAASDDEHDSHQKIQPPVNTTVVELKDIHGDTIGTAAFAQLDNHVFLKVRASGLTPGKHGFHIHQDPILKNDFATAGGHFNPTGHQHGHENRAGAHLGDMPNLVADANGKVDQMILLDNITLKEGALNSIVGRSLIIHAAEDDGITDPSGNSGARIAGGNIFSSNDLKSPLN